MRSTRIYLTIAFLAVIGLGAFWAVGAQEGPQWAPPTVVPTDERAPSKSVEKKSPILIGGQPFNEKPKPADPSLIIPAAAFEKPQRVPVESGTGIVQTGGAAQVEPAMPSDKAPSLPALPGLIPDLPASKPLVVPEPPAPLPTPMPVPPTAPVMEPTKVLIADPPTKKELPALPPTMLLPQAGEKKELPPPNAVLEPKQIPTSPAPAPSMLEIKKPTTLIAPSPKNEEDLKSFVRVRKEQSDSQPIPTPGPLPEPPGPVPAPLPPTPAPYSAPSPVGSSLLTIQTPSLIVEKRGTGPTYQIVVRNVGTVLARNVRIEDELPSDAKLASAQPMPTMLGEKATWVVPEIASQSEVTFHLTIHTLSKLPARHHTSVYVSASSQTHTAALPVRHEVNAPVNALTIQLIGPIKATVGKPVLMNIRVGNQTDRPISGIKLYGVLPEGLDTPEGRKIEGPEEGMVFQPGEIKTLKMPADAVKAGRYVVHVKVATNTGIEARDSAPIDITGATLAIQQAPQAKLLPGRDGDLRIEVTNHTGQTLRNVAVVNRLPEGLDFIDANEAGLYQANSRTVYWTLKELPEGKTQTLYVRVNGAKAGQYQNTVSAKADGVAVQTSTGQVLIEGIADLTLRVVDHEGPTYVGREITYEIQVQNRGLSPGRNVQLQVQFPPGLTPKSAQGPVRHSLNATTVAFEPIASVGPQSQSVFRVTAVAQATGDQRVRFAIISEQVRNPIQREISTMVFRD